MSRKLTNRQMNRALEIVAAWMGPVLLDTVEPAPTGREAAWNGVGPVLFKAWDFPRNPGPAIVMEGDDWTRAFLDAHSDTLQDIGIFAEPYNDWALCLYPA